MADWSYGSGSGKNALEELKKPQRWVDIVHEQRKAAALAQARTEFRLKKRGRAVEAKPIAKIPALLVVAGAVSSLALWRREGERIRAADVRSLPGVRQLLAFLESSPQPGAARGQVRPRAVATPSARGGAGADAASSSSWVDEQPHATASQQVGWC
jgi:hypothetical protein